jgi:4-alpha-glucanotransferase
MPSEPDAEFGDPANYPYMCVASPSCHDTSTTRAWYEEDAPRRQRFTVRLFPFQFQSTNPDYEIMHRNACSMLARCFGVDCIVLYSLTSICRAFHRSSWVYLGRRLRVARLKSCMQSSSSMWTPLQCGRYSPSRYTSRAQLSPESLSLLISTTYV